jgi:outer membrane immunogenic protein
VAAVPLFTWSGFYAGVNAGYGFGHNDLSVRSDAPNFFDDALDVAGFGRSKREGSFTGGAQVGYNYQMGSIVVGAETDFNYFNVNDHYVTDVAYVDGDAVTETLTGGHKVQWLGTLRPRLGFTPAERLLVYATGGLAYGSVKTRSSYVVTENGADVGSFAASRSNVRWGWTIGAGAEYAVTNNLSLKAEYLYVDFDSKHLTATDADNPGLSYNVKDETRFQILRAGLNYRFNSY